MKKRTLFIGLLLLIGFNYLYAQQVPQPDFIDIPAYYIEGENELHNLAKENATMKSKMSETLMEMDGLESKIRIKSSDKYVFIIKATDRDPSQIVQLKTATKKKKLRQVSYVQMIGVSKTSLSADAIPYTLIKLENNIYQIKPDSTLEPGEYVFLVGPTLYSFGIDE